MNTDLIHDFARVLVQQHSDGQPFKIDLQDVAATDALIRGLENLGCEVHREIGTGITIAVRSEQRTG